MRNSLAVILMLVVNLCLFSARNITLGLLDIDSQGHNASLTTPSGYQLQLNLAKSFSSPIDSYFFVGKVLTVIYQDKTILKVELLDNKEDVEVYKFKWSNIANYDFLRDDILLDNMDGVHWYGGMMRLQEAWPINATDEIKLMPYVLDDLWAQESLASGQERYWLCSKKIALFVPDWVPLWHAIQDGTLTFQAQLINNVVVINSTLNQTYNSPYLSFPPTSQLDFLEYEIWIAKDDRTFLKDFYQTTQKGLLYTPTATPDPELIKKPIWTTWARYYRDVNESLVLEFADEIKEYGFPIAQMELDDGWNTHYGDFKVNETKFPNFTGMIQELHAMDIRLTAWVTPFVKNDSNDYINQSLHDYFIKTSTGQPGYVWWWDGPATDSYAVDFTNPKAFAWFALELNQMGVYAFKFDAGSCHYLPNDFRMYSGTEPNDYSRAYVRFAASFGGAVEARVGSRTQALPILIRTLDRSSDWYQYGLQTLIPNTFTFGLHGYFWNLPDIIGGNGVDPSQPDQKQLYIRWVQTTTFLITMQFSVTPWDFDEETVNITRKMLQIRANWTDYLIEETQKAVLTGVPVYRPLWWELESVEAFTNSDQFFVGDRLLIAPVVQDNATSRQVILPSGLWKDQNGVVIEGSQTITVQASLDVLPFFERVGRESNNSSTSGPTKLTSSGDSSPVPTSSPSKPTSSGDSSPSPTSGQIFYGASVKLIVVLMVLCEFMLRE